MARHAKTALEPVGQVLAAPRARQGPPAALSLVEAARSALLRLGQHLAVVRMEALLQQCVSLAIHDLRPPAAPAGSPGQQLLQWAHWRESCQRAQRWCFCLALAAAVPSSQAVHHVALRCRPTAPERDGVHTLGTWHCCSERSAQLAPQQLLTLT